MEEQKAVPTVEDRVEEILKKISDALDVPVELIAPGSENKVKPGFDLPAIISKFYALMVFSSVTVNPVTPPYNRVHADVEYWKKKFEQNPS